MSALWVLAGIAGGALAGAIDAGVAIAGGIGGMSVGKALRLIVLSASLLAAGELYGLAGVLLAMPLVAIGREVAAFLLERISLEPWREGGPIPVEVEVEPADEADEPVPAAGE